MDVTYEREGSLGVITLNRPNRRNALSLGLMNELIACLTAVGRDREIRAVILSAAGPAFCSGHDLSETVGGDINQYRRLFDVCTELMEKLQSIPRAVIAEAQGIYTQIDLDQQKAYGYAKEIMTMNLMAADAQEGITAFLEKRPACWVGR